MAAAAKLAETGCSVLLLVREAFLGHEICAAHRYELTKEDFPETEAEYASLWNVWFANDVFLNGSAVPSLHPDRFQIGLENWCLKTGIQFWYLVRCIGWERIEDGVKVLTAGKFGEKELVCHHFIPIVNREETDCFAAHLMKQDRGESGYRMLYVPAQMIQGESFPEWKTRAVQTVMQTFDGMEGWQLGRFGQRGFNRGKKIYEYLKTGWQKGISILQENSDQTMGGLAEDRDRRKQIDFGRYDVVVVGGGTSGAMAALHAARNNCSVLLLEWNDSLGGTACVGGVSTYWFGNRFADVREIDELVGEEQWRDGITFRQGIWGREDDFHPDLKADVLMRLNQQAGVHIVTDALVYACITENNRLSSVCFEYSQRIGTAQADYIIDATGDADVAVLAGADYTYGSERDYITYWASLAQYMSPRTYKNNFSSTVVIDDIQSCTDFIYNGRRRGKEPYDHGSYIAMRQSRHIKGKSTVTLKDVVSFKCWEDGIYTCYSNYDPKGKISADMVYAGVLPPQNSVQIPLSACIPTRKDGTKLEGLLVAGKAISCTAAALPGIRMQTDLMHQGCVLGLLAAKAVKAGIDVDEMEPVIYRKWIRNYTQDPLTLPNSSLTLKEAVASIGKERTHWIDMPFTDEEKKQTEALAIMCANSEEILPLLELHFEKIHDQGGAPEVLEAISTYLLWHGSDTGTKYLIKQMLRKLKETDGLPIRDGGCTCAQLLPDHGVMTEFTYRLNVLAWSEKKEILPLFEVVLKRILDIQRDYLDIRKGMFHYIEAFAYVAERTGFVEFIPMLRILWQLPEVIKAYESEDDTDILTERLLILRLILVRAASLLGDPNAKEELVKMSTHKNRTIALSAEKELEFEKKRCGRIIERIW